MNESGENDPREDLSAVFAALANADRLMILEVMRQRSATAMTVTQVADAVELSRFSASRHLRILTAAGLIEVQRCRQALLHRIQPAAFELVEDWLYPLVGSDTRDSNARFAGVA